jgi:pimeloyl-ACP methyl ester carboxylesterase
VVLEAGAFGFSADWASVQTLLAQAGFRSMAYDRAGLGFSDPAAGPRDAAAIGADLDQLLAALGEAGPYIYCGHSMAGIHARMFAARHPGLMAGVVLVDATAPEAVESPAMARLIGAFALICRAAAAGAALGLLWPLSLLGLGNAIGVEGPAAEEKRWAFSDPRHNHGAALEVEAWIPSARQALGVGAFKPDLPVTAILAGGRGPARAATSAPESEAGGGYIIRVEGASHASLLGPRYADVIVHGVTLLGEARARDLGESKPEQDAVA